ncbi:MAG: hypothetical protein AAGA95_05345 [Pseudomonadota bacterium]
MLQQENHPRREMPLSGAVIGLFLAAMTTASTLCASWAYAAPCVANPINLRPGDSTAVRYTAKSYEPGYRFSLGGVNWELQELTVTDPSGNRSFSVVYPFAVAGTGDVASRDFFFSIEANENDGGDCSDMPAGDPLVEQDWLLDQTLYVTDNYQSHLRPGVFSESLNQLETMRKLETSLRVREAGFEVIVATGFASTQSMDLRACLNAPGDTLGIVENQPGEIHISCYPAEETNDYVSNIDWIVDYHWPRNPSALIDDLIDYVQVVALP